MISDTFTNTVASENKFSIEKLLQVNAEMEKLGKPGKVAIVAEPQWVAMLEQNAAGKPGELKTLSFSGIPVFKESGGQAIIKSYELRMKGFKVCLIINNVVAVLEPLLPAKEF